MRFSKDFKLHSTKRTLTYENKADSGGLGNPRMEAESSKAVNCTMNERSASMTGGERCLPTSPAMSTG